MDYILFIKADVKLAPNPEEVMVRGLGEGGQGGGVPAAPRRAAESHACSSRFLCPPFVRTRGL